MSVRIGKKKQKREINKDISVGRNTHKQGMN